MDIKQHIEAGHYPVDEKGRALVPTNAGENETAIILASDLPGVEPIAAYVPHLGVESFKADGSFNVSSPALILLPPPPRKVNVTKWGQARSSVAHDTRDAALQSAHQFPGLGPVVELTGEYEEEWT